MLDACIGLGGAAVRCAGTDRSLLCSSRGALTIVAAQNAKQRQRLSEKQRLYNKDRKSAVATRMKKVMLLSGSCRASVIC